MPNKIQFNSLPLEEFDNKVEDGGVARIATIYPDSEGIRVFIRLQSWDEVAFDTGTPPQHPEFDELIQLGRRYRVTIEDSVTSGILLMTFLKIHSFVLPPK